MTASGPLTDADRRDLALTASWTAGALGLVFVAYALFVPDLIAQLQSGDIPARLAPLRGLLLDAPPPDAAATDRFWVIAGRIMLTRALLGVVLIALLITFARYRARVIAFITAFFAEPDHPLNLAIARMLIFSLIFSFADILAYQRLLAVPLEFRHPPVGMGWLLPLIPLPEAIGIPFIWLFAATTLLTIFGFGTRIVAPISALCTFYALGLGQCYGQVNPWHHLFWLSVILAASPCADSLSLDAWWRQRRALRLSLPTVIPSASPAYGRPLRLMWVLIAVAYVGPGFWKLWQSGLDWMTGDNLKWLLYSQWSATHWQPAFRIDQVPYVLDLAAIGTVVFELSFICAVWFRPTRALYVVLALAMHTGILLFLKMNLALLMKSYAIFIDWASLARHLPSARLRTWLDGTGTLPGRDLPGTLVGWLGTFLIVMNLAFAFLGIEEGWPFTSYPRSAGIHGIHFLSETSAMALDLKHRDGHITALDAAALKTASGLSPTQYDILNRNFVQEQDPERRLLIVEQLTQLLADRGAVPSDITSVYAFVEVNSIHPDEQSHNPIHREPFAAIPWRTPSDLP